MLERRTGFCVTLVSGLLVVACGRAADRPGAVGGPAGPSHVEIADQVATAVPAASAAAVPFASQVAWAKTEGMLTSLCTRPLPAGKMYLMRNTITGAAESTHLGAGTYEGHTCVYGTPGIPEGWFGEVRWTAANGDVLLATSAFRRWTGTPGSSIAIEDVAFQDGGTGRFEFAEGQAVCNVNAPGRSAVYEGTLRFGRQPK
jgi:hypothetical protein